MREIPVSLAGVIDDVVTWSIPLVTRFRGITTREGMLLHGCGGWAEWSPFTEYGDAEAAAWLHASLEAATAQWPTPTADRVGVNVTVPVLPPDRAGDLVAASGCHAAKVKVADPRCDLADDLARVAAVRAALGPQGRLRVDANGAWTVAQAEVALGKLARYELEYAEQPCASTIDLARLRASLRERRIEVPIAADESIRRSGDPERVVALGAADVAVLKVQPLGGMAACARLAGELGLPVVISSALETSVGIAPALALAASLPGLNRDCGLNTVTLLDADLCTDSLVARQGIIAVRRPPVDLESLARSQASPPRQQWWNDRLTRVAELLGRTLVGRPHQLGPQECAASTQTEEMGHVE